jgi:hypothetical protein
MTHIRTTYACPGFQTATTTMTPIKMVREEKHRSIGFLAPTAHLNFLSGRQMGILAAVGASRLWNQKAPTINCQKEKTMAFADPAVVTINAVAKNLVRINQDAYGSTYRLRSATDDITMIVKNSSYFSKKLGVQLDRHSVDITQTVFATGSNPAFTRHCYVVLENQQGDTLTDPVYMASGLLSFLTASTNANLNKLMNSES